jgi:LuxR family maltose regulon positive regulatory protein
VLLAGLEIAAGNLQVAAQVLQEEQFRRLEEQGVYHFWRTSVQVRLWLAEGNMAEAHAWAAREVLHPADWEPMQSMEVLTLVRVYLAGQQYSQALEILEAFRVHIDRPGNIEDTIPFLALSATALHLAGEQDRARTTVLRLLNLTRQEGYLRVYLDMGEPMRELLQSLLDAPPEQDEKTSPVPGSYISTLLAAIALENNKRVMRREASGTLQEQEQRISPSTTLSGSPTKQPMLLESLTAQEQRVLHLLAAGRSTQEMAQALVVSRNTVKTHLRNLYSKLQANSRTQALALARDLQLL